MGESRVQEGCHSGRNKGVQTVSDDVTKKFPRALCARTFPPWSPGCRNPVEAVLKQSNELSNCRALSSTVEAVESGPLSTTVEHCRTLSNTVELTHSNRTVEAVEAVEHCRTAAPMRRVETNQRCHTHVSEDEYTSTGMS